MNEQTKNRKILIVEDDPDLNHAYTIILGREGYEVESVFDGESAKTKLESFEPDLVLLDLRMPRLDGVGFLRESKFAEAHPNTPVIVFTNFDENEEIKSAFELGATHYVLKSSISPKDLAKLVKDELAFVS